jgi:putative transposase
MSRLELVTIELEDRNILTLSTSKKRNMLIAEKFISGIAKVHRKFPISTVRGKWYPLASRSPKLSYNNNSSWGKILLTGQ